MLQWGQSLCNQNALGYQRGFDWILLFGHFPFWDPIATQVNKQIMNITGFQSLLGANKLIQSLLTTHIQEIQSLEVTYSLKFNRNKNWTRLVQLGTKMKNTLTTRGSCGQKEPAAFSIKAPTKRPGLKGNYLPEAPRDKSGFLHKMFQILGRQRHKLDNIISLFNSCHYMLQNITLRQTAKTLFGCFFFLFIQTADKVLPSHLFCFTTDCHKVFLWCFPG